MAAPATRIDSRSWAMLVALSVLWGASFLFAGIAVRELPPMVIVMARVVIAAIALLPVHLLVQGSLPGSLRVWRDFAVMSLLNNILPFTLFITGLTYISSGLGSVINATTPLFALAILALFREEALSARKIAGLVLGLAGVGIIKGLEPLSSGTQAIGILLCLAAALSYGFAALWAKRRLAGVPPLTSATCQLLCSMAMMIPITAAFSAPSLVMSASPQVWASLVGLALLSTSLAYIVFFAIVARSGASTVMLVTMMIPVSAILLGHLVLDEVLKAREIIGALVIGASLLVIDGRLFNLFGAAPASRR